MNGRGERIRTSDLSVPNEELGKNLSFAFSKVAATTDFLGFYIPPHSLQSVTRRVLEILATNFPQGN